MPYNEIPPTHTHTYTQKLAEAMSAKFIKALNQEKLWIGVTCIRSCKVLLELTSIVVLYKNSPLCWAGRFCNWFCAISVWRWSRLIAKLFFSCGGYLNVSAQNNIYPSADNGWDTQKDELKLRSAQFRWFLDENSF